MVSEAFPRWTKGTTEGLEGQDFAHVVRVLTPVDVGAGKIIILLLVSSSVPAKELLQLLESGFDD